MRCRLTWEKDRPGHACLRDGEPFVYRGAIICLLAKVASTRLKLLLLKSARVPRFPDVTPGDADRFDTDPHGETLPDSVSVHVHAQHRALCSVLVGSLLVL